VTRLYTFSLLSVVVCASLSNELVAQAPAAEGVAPPAAMQDELVTPVDDSSSADEPVALIVDHGGPAADNSPAGSDGETRSRLPWWAWSLILFVFTLVLGVIAVLGGVGGGVLFVPIVGTFFPFHMDFVRGTSLLVALAGSLSAGSGLLRKNLTSVRLVFPVAIPTALAALAGAMVGLAVPQDLVRIALGIAIMGIAGVMLLARKSEYPEVAEQDRLGEALRIAGIYFEPSQSKAIEWKTHRTGVGIVLFIGVGFMAGMFGLGAGWANVPVFNLVMGAPLKIAAGASGLLISIADSAAAWTYLNKGAVIPLITVPSVAGMILGAKIGGRMLSSARPAMVRRMVISLMVFAGLSSLLKGLGVL